MCIRDSYQLYLNQWLQIRWRRWLTQTYLRQWLHSANHYRMQLLGCLLYTSTLGRSASGDEVIMAKLKFRPLHDRVVVKRIDAEEKSKGGIIIPDTVKEKPQEGEIVAVGPGGRDENGKLVVMGVKAGDRVPVSYTHLCCGGVG